MVKPKNKFWFGDFKVLLMDTPNVMEIKENDMKFLGMFKWLNRSINSGLGISKFY
jgi:hypothetical protein